MVKKLPLQTGEYALVDDEDYERCKEYNWYVENEGKVVTWMGDRLEYLSRYIINCSEEEQVIKTGEWYDYRRGSLKAVTHAQKVRRKHGNKKGSSIYKGVSWQKGRNKWNAQIGINGKTKNLGYFLDEWEAAKAYNRAALEAWGEYVFLNVKGESSASSEIKRKQKINHRRDNKNSSVRGIRWDGWSWLVKCKREYIGSFSDIKEAKQAYDQAAWDHWQEQAVLHYPENIPAYQEGTYRKEKSRK